MVYRFPYNNINLLYEERIKENLVIFTKSTSIYNCPGDDDPVTPSPKLIRIIFSLCKNELTFIK